MKTRKPAKTAAEAQQAPLFRRTDITPEQFFEALALQLPTCFEMRTLSGGLVRSAPE
jgi:hypothetical protein